ncbi:MAG: phosphopantothenoylcysteine decarboxylase [Pirellulales bacterium]|nr:phosphopantothenoylcysteine decarboxylase [Pirellulales bacterium]
MNGRELVVGVTGGVAAYKTAMLVSQLVQAGAGVSVVLTEAATHFIGPATFAALTGRKVHVRGFDEGNHPLGPHIDLAAQGELLVVAPATANFLSQVAHGAADDLLSTLVLAFRGPVILAPAMNNQMWDKPSVQRNVAQLREDGYSLVGPEEGWLSCRTRAVGRMSAPEAIYDVIAERLKTLKPR